MMLLWGATAAAFALWITLALRSLVRLAARTWSDRGGPGPVRRFLHDPGFRTDRRALGYATLALAALALAFAAALALVSR
jgi:hypothetical protein